MAEKPGDIRIEVCYAKPDASLRRDLVLPSGAVLQDAILQSGILHEAPEIDLALCRVGIYGKLKTLDTMLRDRDRVEIYRPLIADPKESRRKRAEKKGERHW